MEDQDQLKKAARPTRKAKAARPMDEPTPEDDLIFVSSVPTAKPKRTAARKAANKADSDDDLIMVSSIPNPKRRKKASAADILRETAARRKAKPPTADDPDDSLEGRVNPALLQHARSLQARGAFPPGATIASVLFCKPFVHPASIPPADGASHFLALPPELRNEIYSYVTPAKLVRIETTRPFVLEPKVLLINRQIYSEALTVFYGESTFQIEGSTQITKFLRFAGEEKLRALRNVQITCAAPLKLPDAIARLEQIMREFGRRGLRRDAIHFEVEIDRERMWRNLDQLEKMQMEIKKEKT